MAYVPVANINFQYDLNIGYWIKFYIPNTTTPIQMATDTTGSTLLAKCEIDITGFPTTDGTTKFIPFLGQAYDAYLFPTEAEADANNTTNAIRIAKNASPFNPALNIDVLTFKPSISASQTVISVPDAPDSINLNINGDIQIPINFVGDTGSYTYSAGTITLSQALVGDEDIAVTYGLIVPVTTVITDGFLSYASVSQMVADAGLASGNRIVTYMYNNKITCLWEISASGNVLIGDVLLGNGLYAVLQVQTIMTMRHYGAYGDGITDDTAAAKRMALVNARSSDHGGDTYLLTDQVLMQNNFKYKTSGGKYLWNGTAGAVTVQGRDWGVFQAIGEQGSNIDSFVLTVDIVEFTESFYYLGNDAAFTGREDTYMVVFAGTLSTPTIPSFSLMPKFIQISGAGRCQLDYRNGWDIPIGKSITYRAVTPKYGIEIEGLHITDISPASGDSADYASAISLGFAYNCHFKNITGVGFRNPIAFCQWVTDCSIDTGRIERPQATGGGQGYFVQWTNALRCDTSNVTGYLSRHLVDHTQSAYCNVSNCRDSNSQDGAFTNHGAYEHDISYQNCVGFHSVGNSGASFGETCKRITIINGNGRSLDADRNIIDLTVINSRFSFVTVNSQGFQASGLIVNDDGSGTNGFAMRSTTTTLGRTTLSKRDNILTGCKLPFNTNYFFSDNDFDGRILYVNDSEIVTYISNPILSGAVHVKGGSWNNVNASALILTTDSSLIVDNVNMTNFGVRQNDGNNNCYLKIIGGQVDGIPTTGIYSNRMNAGSVGVVEITGVKLDAAAGIIIDMPETAETSGMFMEFSRNSFANGTITIKNQYSGAGKLMYTNNLLDTITEDVGATAGRRLNTDNITV